MALQLGYSSCPNDTFMFHALVTGQIDAGDMGFDVYMEDIQALNERALGRLSLAPLPITKVSASAMAQLTARYTVLDSGAALGRGVGPLVVTRSTNAPDSLSALGARRIAVPGLETTACLLLRCFAPANIQLVPMRFEQIMPAVEKGEVDAGLIIHESRFTYGDHGLSRLADLGEIWESETDLPLPLGLIVADRSLETELIERFEDALSRSVRHAHEHPSDSAAYVAEHAQEMSPEVCRQHIALYVNAHSVSIGTEGRAAVDELLRRGRTAGLLPADLRSPWR